MTGGKYYQKILDIYIQDNTLYCFESSWCSKDSYLDGRLIIPKNKVNHFEYKFDLYYLYSSEICVDNANCILLNFERAGDVRINGDDIHVNKDFDDKLMFSTSSEYAGTVKRLDKAFLHLAHLASQKRENKKYKF